MSTMAAGSASILDIRPSGPRALLVEFASHREVRNYYAEARRRRGNGDLPPSIELVPTARTLLLDEVDDCPALARELRAWDPGDAAAGEVREVEIPTVYDGPDLASVAELWGMTAGEAVDTHIAFAHEVAFLGFAPGFAYVSGIPDDLSVPRMPRPRTRVPAGSVSVADQFTGIYPRDSPGGWRIIGHTRVVMWDTDRDPAAYLMPGDRVRFVAVSS